MYSFWRRKPGIEHLLDIYIRYHIYLCCHGGHLLHHQHAPKSWMPTQHMIVCFVSLCKRELFNHALDVMKLRKVDGFFAIQRVARRPAMNRCALGDQARAVDFHLTGCCYG